MSDDGYTKPRRRQSEATFSIVAAPSYVSSSAVMDAERTRRVHAREAEAARVVKPKPPVPLWRWILWMATLGVALFVFYVLFTPFWFALRVLAWIAEFRSRRRSPQTEE